MKDFLQNIFNFLKDLYNKLIKFLKSISPGEEKSAEVVNPAEDQKPAEKEKPIEEEKSAEDEKSV